jgi:CelD/BcsL family acetyltransferase involved in cellulose biosynthesis
VIHAELLPLHAIGPRERGRWRELAARALEPNPFFEPEFVLPLARGVGDGDDVRLAVVHDHDTWLACLPVRRYVRWHRVPLPSLSVWQGHRLYSLLGTPLLADSDDVAGSASALVRLLVRAPGTFFSALEWLVESGPVCSALRAGLAANGIRTLVFERFERAFLNRRPAADYLADTISAKHRRELRRQWRKLGEQLGDPQIVQRPGDSAAVAELMELEGRSTLATRGSVLQADPGHVYFFREMCNGFAADGRLQVLALTAGGRTLALKCNLLAGEGIFYFKIAYDHDYANFSPGIQLEVEMVNLFHAHSTAGWMDSCADANNAMINRLWPDRRRIVTIVAIPQNVGAFAAVPALRSARLLRQRMIEG